jgi:predicted outer membrane protein
MSLPSEAKSRKATTMMTMPISQVDREYLTKDAQGSVYDQSTANLAAQKARSSALHGYAIQLIGDHARLNQVLLTLARTKGITVPVTLADEDKSKLDNFSGMSGQAFDRAIIAEFVKINGDDVRDGRKELSLTRDPQVRRAVTEFVRTEEKHLRQARALQNQLAR